ncbi:MAG: NAD(P)/FAD-dependent oxidoreductase [Isosphaeraceae bacterium]
MKQQPSQCNVVVIGGGPAGLTAALELTDHGLRPIVLERSQQVGGIARTESFKGFRFDMGGHRFFSKSGEVRDLWHRILGGHFLRRPRMSRIFYKRKFFHYPLRPFDALAKLGIVEGVLIVLSYLRWQVLPYRQVDTFEQWVTNRFGRRLFLTFFKSYTEKVWGIPCSELKAEWAAQRIKNLTLGSALLSWLFKPRNAITSLIDQFDYPELGPGMMWEAFRHEIEGHGGVVKMGCDVVEIAVESDRVVGVHVRTDGKVEFIPADHVISSMPVTEFIKRITPAVPEPTARAASQLKYRDFLTVCLIVDRAELFADNWIYIHEPEVMVGRIQNFKNWSPMMVPDQSKTSLGLEYFCNEGDQLWNTSDAELVELGKRELEHIGLVDARLVEDGCVFRVPKSYPVYDSDYRECLATIKTFLEGLKNFQTVGRNGLHRYNNQDHAMLTGLYAARNLVLGETNDLWNVNVDQDYHEEVREPRGGSSEHPVTPPEQNGAARTPTELVTAS